VRDACNNGEHNSKTRLRAAQWQFDLAKKSAKHHDKQANRMAEKHPYLPVVAATTIRMPTTG
jgi:threonine aldolase